MKTGTLLAIALFVLVALAHLGRMIIGLEVTIGSWVAPMWISVVGVIVPAGIAFLLYREAG